MVPVLNFRLDVLVFLDCSVFLGLKQLRSAPFPAAQWHGGPRP